MTWGAKNGVGSSAPRNRNEDETCREYLFADDTNLFVCGRTLDTVMAKANSSVKDLVGPTMVSS